MKQPKELDCVTLQRDLPEFRLRAGDVGTVVFEHGDEAVIVEFMDQMGRTVALLTLLTPDVRVSTKKELAEQRFPESLPPGVEAPIADAFAVPRPAR